MAGAVVALVAHRVLGMPLATPANVLVFSSVEIRVVALTSLGDGDALDVLGVPGVRVTLIAVMRISKAFVNYSILDRSLPRLVEKANVLRGSLLRSRIRVANVRVGVRLGHHVLSVVVLSHTLDLIAP